MLSVAFKTDIVQILLVMLNKTPFGGYTVQEDITPYTSRPVSHSITRSSNEQKTTMQPIMRIVITLIICTFAFINT